MDDEDDENKIRVKLVKLPILTGSHMVFHTWWFDFHAFATMWKFAEAIRRTPEMDLPPTGSVLLSTHNNEKNCLKVAKKHNAIAFVN